MLDKEQKQILYGAVVLVLILGIITLTSRPEFLFKEPAPTAPAGLTAEQAQKYLDYLASLKIDPAASQELFEQILTKEDIEKEVQAELQVGQNIANPSVDTAKLATNSTESQAAAEDYLAKLAGSVLNFNTQTVEQNKQLFVEGADLGNLREKTDQLVNELYSLPAPEDASSLQISAIKAFTAYKELVGVAEGYSGNADVSPWPQVYANYEVINNQAFAMNAEVKKIATKYNIAETKITPVYAFGDNDFHFIPRAHAFLGIGDVTITLGDIPRLIMDAVEQGLASSFAQFMGVMLNKLITKLEANYKIANFLYYTDALVSGQYTEDYLQKYVANNLDRQVIKRFIPQFSCGASVAELKPVFQSKAQQYLGFNISSLQPSDPDYYQKLARVGDPLTFTSGWQIYYDSIAAQTASEAEKAAQNELNSPGIKSPRDTVKSAIGISINNIVSASRASLNALMNLGIASAKNYISTFVAQLTQSLVNKFVFQGVVSNSGGLGVLKEQSTCLAVAQLSPVLALDPTTYVAPVPAPTPEQLLQQECSKFPRGCTIVNDPAPSP